MRRTRLIGFFQSVFSLLIFLQSASSLAEPVKTIAAVGTHYPLFKVEKNIHPENKLVVFTRLKENCELALDESQNPVFDFYWLMNGVSYKPTHSLIKAQIRKRMLLGPEKSKQSFMVMINDLKELKTDLENPQMTITSRKSKKGKECQVGGTMTLGPSDNHQILLVQTIDSKTEGMLRPKILSVTLKGISAATGEALSRTYSGR